VLLPPFPGHFLKRGAALFPLPEIRYFLHDFIFRMSPEYMPPPADGYTFFPQAVRTGITFSSSQLKKLLMMHFDKPTQRGV
jgi:hypothetical protein